MTFTIAQTKTTPLAEFRNGCLTIRGKSVPFNPPEMYETIRDRMLVYMQNPETITQVDIYLSAINAVSKRSIMTTFSLFEEMNRKGYRVHINWFYQPDDDDIQEMGEICKSAFELDIELKEKE